VVKILVNKMHSRGKIQEEKNQDDEYHLNQGEEKR
jgi:hypothetical protein